MIQHRLKLHIAADIPENPGVVAVIRNGGDAV